MKRLLCSAAFCMALIVSAGAQGLTTPNGAKSDQILLKLHQLDLLNQILPLVLTKDQINSILPVLEKERAKERQVMEQEDNTLADMAPDIDQTLDSAINKGVYPTRAFLDKVAKSTSDMGKRRQVSLALFTTQVTDGVMAVLNVGQKKALINSFDPKFIDARIKPADMPDTMKIEFFMQRVFMDPLTHDLLVKILDKKT